MIGRVLHEGSAAGRVLRLDEPLSFWGGLDPTTGRIIDQAHPQVGELVGGRVVAMPGSRGSSGTPGVLAEALRRDVGPAAILLTKADINLTGGALVAQTLYGSTCPIVLLDQSDHRNLPDGSLVAISPSGSIKGVPGE